MLTPLDYDDRERRAARSRSGEDGGGVGSLSRRRAARTERLGRTLAWSVAVAVLVVAYLA